MLFGDNYCSKCGANLKCFNCGGTGKVKDLSPKFPLGTYCCGRYQSDNYCSTCGKSLKPLFELPKETTCPICNGSGRTFHVCRGY